jgi:hypothetical protein
MTGLLTSLALVHTLEPVSLFSGGRKVAAYVGLEPMERSSADKQRFLGISKGGSRLLRYLLVEAAQTAIRTDSDLKQFYLRVAPSRGWQMAKTETVFFLSSPVRPRLAGQANLFTNSNLRKMSLCQLPGYTSPRGSVGSATIKQTLISPTSFAPQPSLRPRGLITATRSFIS